MIRGSQSISDLTNAIEPNGDSRLSEHSGAISAQGKALFVFSISKDFMGLKKIDIKMKYFHLTQ